MGFLHVDAAQVLAFVILGSPLAGLLVNNELPRSLRGQGVEGVASRRHFHAANVEIDFSIQGGGLIGAGAPHFAERSKFLPYLSAFKKRPAVVDGYFLAFERNCCGLVGAGTFALVLWWLLRDRQNGDQHEQRDSNC